MNIVNPAIDEEKEIYGNKERKKVLRGLNQWKFDDHDMDSGKSIKRRMGTSYQRIMCGQ